MATSHIESIMLNHLTIRNFALVDQLDLDLDAGMTVVTGETGAGKSIMLDALALTLGNRADAGSVGLHADKTEIFATFDVKDNPDASRWLKQHDLANDEHECILRRVITKEGRSKAYVNGAPCTLADLKQLGDTLADIHSQHEHQSLLKKETHRKLLDEFAGALPLAAQVSEYAATYEATRRRLEEMISNTEEQAARAQLLSYQLEEIDALDLKHEEELSLEAEQKTLANAESILLACQRAIQLCDGDESNAALELVNQSVQALRAVDAPELKATIEMLTSAKIQLEEASQDLQRFSNDFEANPARLTEVEQRLTAIYDLSRKHRIQPSELSELINNMREELKNLENFDSEAASLEVELESMKQDYLKAASKLSDARKKAAKKIQTAVTGHLANLGMKDATFAVELEAIDQIHSQGQETVEFLISTNPGQPPKALNKIASGGELSRISLAIQVTTANTSRVPSLVFDEVDVGIGGGVAEVVGSLLRNLGKQAQIICVTHLAQVAAQGHQHLIVSKGKTGKKLSTEVKCLAGDDRIAEIARMLGGIDMTENSIAHAEEMYQSAQAASR